MELVVELVLAVVFMLLAYIVFEAWEWLADRRIEREWARIQEEQVARTEQSILAGIRRDAAVLVELAAELCVDIQKDADDFVRNYEARMARQMARMDEWQWRSTVDAIRSRAQWHAARGDSTPTMEAIEDVLGGGR